MALAPWNTPPNFLGAMQAGASLGAQLRGQDIARSEAADRLSLAYNQLAAEEQQRNESAQMRMQMAREAEAYKQNQLNMLQQWHQAQVENQRQAIDVQRRKLAEPSIHFGTEGEVLKYDPTSGTVTEMQKPREKAPKQPTVRVPMDPNNPFGPTMTGAYDDPEVQKRLTEAMKPPTPLPDTSGSFNLMHPSTWRNPFAGLLGGGGTQAPTPPVPDVAPIGTMPTSTPALGAPSTPAPFSTAPTPPAVAPFKEGALIRSKKNGKLYRVTNGVPVEQSTPSSDNSQGEAASDESTATGSYSSKGDTWMLDQDEEESR